MNKEINMLQIGDSKILPKTAKFVPYVGRVKRFSVDGTEYFYKSIDESEFVGDLKVNAEILCELYLSRLASNDFGLTTPIYFVAKDLEYIDNYASIGVFNKDFKEGYAQVKELQAVEGSKEFYTPTIKMIVDSGVVNRMTSDAFDDIKKLMFFDYFTAQTDRHGRNLALATDDTFWNPTYNKTLAFDYGNSFLAVRDLDNINETAIINHLDVAGYLKLGLETPRATYQQFVDEAVSSMYIKDRDRWQAVDLAAKVIDNGRVAEIGEELESDCRLERHKGFEHILNECLKFQTDRLANAIGVKEMEKEM